MEEGIMRLFPISRAWHRSLSLSLSFSLAQSCFIGIALLSFNSILVAFVANLFCAWFRVVALVVHGRRGGFCRDAVIWSCEVMRLHFGTKEWPINEVG
jgi:hypothetical protein